MTASAEFRLVMSRFTSFLCTACAMVVVTACASTPSTPAAQPGQSAAGADTRGSLRPGWRDAGVSARGVELVAHADRPQGFYDERELGNILLANSDIAFQGNHLFLGNFHGFQILDIADPRSPRMLTAFPCPGGQGDLSVYRNLLFMSVEMPNGRVDCTPGALNDAPDRQRFLGVRIFDISDISKPRQVAAVQTCRGSHTHTLVTDARDNANVYIYVSGTSGVRPPSELAGCSGGGPEDPNTARFRIEVIRVPLAAPQNATIVNTPRIFANQQTGAIAGLWRGGAHGAGTQNTAMTDQCHDITVFPELGIAAGACSGNGILLDISDPANPKRTAEVTDPNFAYWHSATFNHDGSKVLYTDEWGGGMAAYCRSSDPRNWGADAIFERTGSTLRLRGYYKLPVAQSEQENCVAHNGSIVPVPGRDIMAQAWYQGGVSIFDFTDTSKPVEIAHFDRGAMNSRELLLGGVWSSYWYNGLLYSSEIGRGLDVLRLTPTDQLTQNEIDAAATVRLERFNPQTQPRVVWPASFVVARAYLDQLRRGTAVPADRLNTLTNELASLERQDAAARRSGLTQLASTVSQLRTQAGAADSPDAKRLSALAQVLTDLAR